MASLEPYGKIGEYLHDHGWRLEVTPATGGGTAACDGASKTIRIKPWAWRNLNRYRRLRWYVLEHELAHAVHYEAFDYDTEHIVRERHLTSWAACEAVADCYCLLTRYSLQMRRWVRQSVLWHGRVGLRYMMVDVEAASTRDMVRRIRDTVTNWHRGDSGLYFQKDGPPPPTVPKEQP